MIKNLVLVSVIPQLAFGSYINRPKIDWNPRINGSESGVNNVKTSINAEYQCDNVSYFQSIGKTYEYPEQVFCDELTIQRTDKSLFAYGYRHGKRLGLNQIGSYVALMDKNGDEVFWRMGQISGGLCDGDLLFIESYNDKIRGSCDSPIGVTDVKSTKTIYAIRGKCESTCFGVASVTYQPGKRHKN